MILGYDETRGHYYKEIFWQQLVVFVITVVLL